MRKELEFTSDYAVYKKGDKKIFSHQLAYELVKLGVAKIIAEIPRKNRRDKTEVIKTEVKPKAKKSTKK